jgi:Rieske Fe-S protein
VLKPLEQPVEVDISDMKPDEIRTVEWRGKPVWVFVVTPTKSKSSLSWMASLLTPSPCVTQLP